MDTLLSEFGDIATMLIIILNMIISAKNSGEITRLRQELHECRERSSTCRVEDKNMGR